jgi:hypothetical protein
LQVPAGGLVCDVDEVVEVDEVVTVAPVPLVVVDEDVLLEVVVEVVVTSGPSHSLEIFNSAQFQNCSGTPRPSSGKGCEHTGRFPG